MAYQSVCPKCNSTQFEIATEEPKNSNFKLLFVRCSSCGAVVGVIDFFNIGDMIHRLAEKLNVKL